MGMRSKGVNAAGQATVRISLATIARIFPPQSLERVYFHGKWQRSRRKNPSLRLSNEPDPRRAFAMARELVGAYLDSVLELPYSRQTGFWLDGHGFAYRGRATAIHERIPPRELYRYTY